MKVLVGCEESGVVSSAFRKRGYEAWSCDISPTRGDPNWHIQDDLLKHLDDGWDLAIFHPPCTHLCVSGARWFDGKRDAQEKALEFVLALLSCSIPRTALENPVSIISSRIRKPDQIIQPWMFGDLESKKTCLWLKNLPPLLETEDSYDAMMKLPIKEREAIHYMSPGPERSRKRSETYRGIADAMAIQWGNLAPEKEKSDIQGGK